MKKRLFALFMACVMTMALAVTAFAAADDGSVTGGADGFDANVEATVTPKDPIIKVTVPTTVDVFLNPYNLKVDVSEDGDGSETSSDPVVTVTQFLISESNVALAVSATVSGVVDVDSGLKLVDTAPTTYDEDKNAYLYLQVVAAGAYDSGESKFAAPSDWGTFNMSTNPVVGTEEVTVENMYTIPAAEFETDLTTVKTPTAAAFRLFGAVAPSPTTPWTAADSVTVTIVFTFTPVAGTTTAP